MKCRKVQKLLSAYLDGELAATTPYAAPITHSTASLLVGQGAGSASYTWTGKLDELAVYSSALTAPQGEEHFAQGARLGRVDVELLENGNPTPVATIGEDDDYGDMEPG